MSMNPQAPAPTARQIVERVQHTLASAGVAWRTDTVDTFKIGDPDQPVVGIATTFMATLSALRGAVAAGANFVISHEPTFYNHLDTTTSLVDDPTYKAKVAFIDAHRLVVFRFHDHWHARRPDGMRVQLLRVFGWPATAQGPIVVPPTTLGVLAADIQHKLGVRALRVVGDPATPITRVALGLGYGNPQLGPAVDVVVTGESQEADSAWDNAAYAQDSMAAAERKGLILMGHERSEHLGMDECATWLRTFVSDVPITFVEAGEPFWAG